MSSSPAHRCAAFMPCKKSRFPHSFQVRAQSYRDHEAGKSSNIVDANLLVLRDRIEQVKSKERLERCCLAEPGWNYATYNQSFKSKRDEELRQLLQLMGTGFGTFGLAILSCSFCLCMVSLLVHLSQ